MLWKELAAIVVMLDVHRKEFRWKCIRISTDNDPVKWMLIKWRADLKPLDLQAMIRMIAEICIYSQITPCRESLKSEENVIADRLSRFQSNTWHRAQYNLLVSAHLLQPNL